MHRDHWIPADDRTKVFRLFGCSLTPIACFGEFDLHRVRGGLGGRNTQKGGCLGLCSEFTFPLVVRGRRAADRLTELRDGSIGSFALGDTFGSNLVSFRGREAEHR
jgi:hypothetical protein